MLLLYSDFAWVVGKGMLVKGEFIGFSVRKVQTAAEAHMKQASFIPVQVCIIMSRASGKTERIIVMVTIAVLHMLFLLYLHFAYHTIVEGRRLGTCIMIIMLIVIEAFEVIILNLYS